MAFQLNQLQRYISPNAYKDLDVFLEKLPQRAGHGIIIAGAIAWLLAGCAVLYASTQASKVMTLRADILKSEALKPAVPMLVSLPVSGQQLQDFAKNLEQLYPQIQISTQGDFIEVKGGKTDVYGAFREAVGHMFNGGKGWRVSVDSLCVGRECQGNIGLAGRFKINRLTVEKM